MWLGAQTAAHRGKQLGKDAVGGQLTCVFSMLRSFVDTEVYRSACSVERNVPEMASSRSTPADTDSRPEGSLEDSAGG
jgi:hypothetical protein